MKDLIRWFVGIAVVLYILSPIDIAPGPVDDALFALLGLAAAYYSPGEQRE